MNIKVELIDKLQSVRRISSLLWISFLPFCQSKSEMNDLPVIGYRAMRIELWDRQEGKHC